MARIIDKDEKRCDIARASVELFVHKGIAQTSIDEIAKSAGVAKGTVYLYFNNKEEIILTIWELLAKSHQEAYTAKINPAMSAKEKILELFNFSECTKEHDKEQILTLYQHLISTMLIDKSGVFTDYLQSLYQSDYDIIAAALTRGIETGELIEHDVSLLAHAIITFMEGVSIKSKVNHLSFEQTQALLTQYITFMLEHYTRKES